MKAVILAGGLGTRLSEETGTRPKPMIEIGGRPILWHIMKIYHHYGIQEFVICCGYMGWMIKSYFVNYQLMTSDLSVDFAKNQITYKNQNSENWTVHLVDTGESTMTGGRVKRVQNWIGNESFLLTYGDGVADINIRELIEFHRRSDAAMTVTAVQPPGRFGALELHGDKISAFKEKPEGSGFINGGFFVCEPQLFSKIVDDSTVLEKQPMESFAREGKLAAYIHKGFWQPMDTLREKKLLDDYWTKGKAPWRIW